MPVFIHLRAELCLHIISSRVFGCFYHLVLLRKWLQLLTCIQSVHCALVQFTGRPTQSGVLSAIRLEQALRLLLSESRLMETLGHHSCLGYRSCLDYHSWARDRVRSVGGGGSVFRVHRFSFAFQFKTVDLKDSQTFATFRPQFE